MYTLKYGESPTNTDAPMINTILQPFYSLDFRNRYVNNVKGRYSNLRHIIHKGLNRLKRTISV